ncbi:MAG TPA: FAD-dependent oxidoreductase [Solirubrobacteraceae bacterium]|jgi:flavin-dependent dehydrogenase|nr:FAD-dependent oxidoreductase [Solirubrobacteraceae bacterium]
MTRRATLRGAERTPLAGDAARADVLICGASFAGLAVARELTGSGADVLVVDRYEIGERATSACAAPTPWLHAMGAERAIRQELPCMGFHTPHGSTRFRLPWSWSAFDYRELCAALWEQCGDARFAVAKVDRRSGRVVHTDRGDLTAPLIVDALGWRRVLGPGPNVQPPDALISRGLEVHPHDGQGVDLDIWIERGVVRQGYAWAVPADGERRIGVGSYAPRDHVKEPTVAMAERLGAEPVRFQGNWFPHALRPAAEDGVLFAGDSAGHCLPLSGEGIRTAFYFGIAAGRELRAVLAGEQDLDAAAARYGAFSARHARAYRIALRLQRLIPALPPRVLTALLAASGRPRLCRPAFSWYLGIAHPRFAAPRPPRIGRTWTTPSPSTSAVSSRASSRTGDRERSSPSPT